MPPFGVEHKSWSLSQERLPVQLAFPKPPQEASTRADPDRPGPLLHTIRISFGSRKELKISVSNDKIDTEGVSLLITGATYSYPGFGNITVG